MSKKYVVDIETRSADIFVNLAWSKRNNIHMIIKQRGSTTKYVFESKEDAVEFKLCKQ